VGMGCFRMLAGATVADTDYAVVVPAVVEEVDRSAVYTWVDPVVTWDTSMAQLAAP
jgi:hypothetical protein